MPASSRELIIGAAIGYNAEQIRPFISSLKSTGYTGDLALIVASKAVKELRDESHLDNVILIPADSWAGSRARYLQGRFARKVIWPVVQACIWLTANALGRIGASSQTRLDRKIAFYKRWVHPQLSRFFFYREYLSSNQYDRVLLSDIRDVVFQDDPFTQLPTSGIAVSIESRKYTIKTNYWNALWIRLGYGRSALDRIGDNPVSCAGITYGDVDSIKRYLNLMTVELLKMPLRAFIQLGDQGIHNYLVWTGKLGSFDKLETLSSPVATLNSFNNDELKFREDGFLLNSDDSLVSIVHQYDRCPALQSRLLGALQTG